MFQVNAWLSRPKNMAASDPIKVTQDMPSDPTESEVAKDAPDKGYN